MSIVSRIYRFLLRHKWKTLIAIAVLLVLWLIVSFATKPKQPEYVTTTAVRGNLVQTVEAVGTVVSERELALQFPMSGIVSGVSVKEGDKVRAGQTLATVRSGNLSADIAGASARLQSAQADLRRLQEGSRPEDIAVSEAEVLNKRASLQSAQASLENAERSLERSEAELEVLRREADISVSGQISTVGSTVSLQLAAAQDALAVVEDVFGSNDVQDAILKDAPEKFDSVVKAKNDAEIEVTAQLAAGSPPVDYESALALIERARGTVQRAWLVLGSAYDALSGLPETGSFTHADKETYKSSLGTERSAMQTALGGLDSASRSLRDAVAGLDTQIAAEESAIVSAQGARDKALADIRTFETSLRIAEAQLALKKAGTRKSDIDAAAARVRQEQASLQRARAEYANTVLTAPIAGIVTKVNVKTGEITPSGAAVMLLGESPFRIEMYVSEIDVPKVLATQSGSVELDAFRGTNFQLRVSQIDTVPTDRDGVSKYRVKLDYLYPHNELKIGMTGDAEIVTGMRRDVVSVPQRAVTEDAQGRAIIRIMREDGTVEERAVQTGMEGVGGNIEVTGVEAGETVVVLIKE